VWLSVSAPPLLERASAAGWVPDSPTHYCRRCGATAQPNQQVGVGEPNGCDTCADVRLPWDRFVRLGEYEAPLEHWIKEVKYTRFRRLGESLGVWLGESIAAEIERARAASPGSLPELPPAIVPAPMSFLHRLTRGIDHALTISRGVRSGTGGVIVPALTRAHRPSQLDVSPSDRRANVARAFRARARMLPRLEGRLVVVVDDVTTTGATLSACVRSLKGLFRSAGSGRGYPPIWAAAAAWTSPERRTGPMS
jgi:predicted amidophosphoribosyltransferase